MKHFVQIVVVRFIHSVGRSPGRTKGTQSTSEIGRMSSGHRDRAADHASRRRISPLSGAAHLLHNLAYMHAELCDARINPLSARCAGAKGPRTPEPTARTRAQRSTRATRRAPTATETCKLPGPSSSTRGMRLFMMLAPIVVRQPAVVAAHGRRIRVDP